MRRAQTTRAQCPGCSANLADDGYSDVLTCAYCGTRVTVHRPHTAPRPAAPRPPTELDALRARLVTEERHWAVRIRAAERVGGADVALPLLGCVVTALVVFIIASANDDRKIDQWWSARVRKLEEDRDRVAPELVRRLNEIEAELGRLWR